jgi:tRNA pseudouridine38/39 synthase
LIEERKSCNYSLCGRTDKGVSALNNAFSITLRSRGAHQAGEFNFCKMLNSQLPDDIRITAFSVVPHHFDARFSCLYREYRYHFIIGSKDLNRMSEACKLFEGVHDFRNFCKEDPEKHRKTERRVLNCRVESTGLVGTVVVVGYSFLWHQVRCMVAVLFKVADGLECPDIVTSMLRHLGQKPQYEIAGETGLVLYDCAFETVEFQPCPVDEVARPLSFIQDDLTVKLQVLNMLTRGYNRSGLEKPGKKIKLKPK